MYDINTVDTDIQTFTNSMIEDTEEPLKIAASLLFQAMFIYNKELSSKDFDEVIQKNVNKIYKLIRNRVLH